MYCEAYPSKTRPSSVTREVACKVSEHLHEQHGPAECLVHVTGGRRQLFFSLFLRLLCFQTPTPCQKRSSYAQVGFLKTKTTKPTHMPYLSSVCEYFIGQYSGYI